MPEKVTVDAFDGGVWLQIEDSFDGAETNDWASLSIADAKKLRDDLDKVIKTVEDTKEEG